MATLIEKGTPAIRITYADGGQNEKFRSTTLAMHQDDRIVTGSSPQIITHLGDVSRPEALNAIQEVAINEKGEVIGTPRPVVTAAAVTPLASPAAPQSELNQPAPASTKAEVAVAKPTKPTVVAAQKPVSAEPQSTGLFGATFSDLSNVFKSASPAPAVQDIKDVAEEKNGFYNKLINVIAPTPAEAETKPDLPAKVPLPPRRQAALSTTQIQ